MHDQTSDKKSSFRQAPFAKDRPFKKPALGPKPTLAAVKARLKPDLGTGDITARRDGMRVAKVLARAGIASRREVERLISLGKIAVNGRLIDQPSILIKDTDEVTLDGVLIGKPEAARLFLYHKPVGLLTTHADPKGRATVFAHLPEGLPRLISVGRLDLNSEGLLLLTNDGHLARSMELPSTAWVRRYRARCLGHTTQAKLDELRGGITVEGIHYGPMDAKLDKMAEKPDGRANCWVSVAITEGKNREVRKVLEAIGLKVNRLIRLAYGPFALNDLAIGAVSEVGPQVLRELLGHVIDEKYLPPLEQTEPEFKANDRVRGGFERSNDRQGSGQGRGASAADGRRGGGARFKTEGRSFGKKPFTPKSDGRSEGIKDDHQTTDHAQPRSFTPRPERARQRDAEPREKRPYSERPYSERKDFSGDQERADKKPYAKKSYGKASDRPFKPRDGDKPKSYSKSARPGQDRPFRPKTPRS